MHHLAYPREVAGQPHVGVPPAPCSRDAPLPLARRMHASRYSDQVGGEVWFSRSGGGHFAFYRGCKAARPRLGTCPESVAGPRPPRRYAWADRSR